MIKRIVEYYESEAIRLSAGALLFAVALTFDFAKFPLTSSVFYILALLVAGAPVFLSAFRGILRRDPFDETFLMSIASVGAMIIGDMSEGVAVILFFLAGEMFEHKAVRRSRASIRSLMNIRPDVATVTVGGVETEMDADDVHIGAEIVIRSGERVPIDSVVIGGSADVDTSMLTGESIPRSVGVGSLLESGIIVLNGTLFAKTLRLAENSSAQRILDLVENASENKAREESFITVFSRIYTPIVVCLAVLVAAFLPLIFDGVSYSESVYRALTFLVISCPCALVISVPMAFFGGIGGAASAGILFKGGNVFSPLARCDSFVFDKTGTVTTGRIRVEEIIPIGIDRESLIHLAASAEHGSSHPISVAIKALSEDSEIPEESREIIGKGIVARVSGREVAVGNSALLSHLGLPSEQEKNGVFAVIDGVLSGIFILGDSVKPQAKSALQKLKKMGAKRLFMLSGDKAEKVIPVACEVGIDEAKSELLPDDKYEELKKIISSSRKTAFVGDGINDSPSLALSDVGIAMGGIGSDSAIEAADVVIMNDDLSKISLAVRIARRTLLIAKENIVFALGVKALVLILGAFGYADMWLAVFADVGVAFIAILNSMRALRVRK